MAEVQHGSMWLVYEDENGEHHTQPWQDVVESGTLIDPESGADMTIVGWMTD